jgi:hypothetical protein
VDVGELSDTVSIAISIPPSHSGFDVSVQLTPKKIPRPPPYGTTSRIVNQDDDTARTQYARPTSAQTADDPDTPDDPFTNESDSQHAVVNLVAQRRIPNHLLPGNNADGDDRYNVPAPLLSTYPPDPNRGMGFVEKKWYVVFRGRYIGVFYDFW